MAITRLIRVTTSYYCAAMIESGGVIIEAAPILRWTIGKTLEQITPSLMKKKAKIELVNEGE